MSRWKNPHCLKHMVCVDKEPLLQRTVRLLQEQEPGSSIVITSHNPAYDIPGATRYEPQNNQLEIDRFTWELIEDGVCFLYGDVYYTSDSIRRICSMHPRTVGFAGTAAEIVAVVVTDGTCMRNHIAMLRQQCLSGERTDCKGWQLYHSIAASGEDCFLRLGETDDTEGFNTEKEFHRFLSKRGTSVQE